MTNKEIIELFNGLGLVGNVPGQKFSYAVARNITALRKSIDNYQSDLKSLQESFAKKEDGKSVIANNQYVMENPEEFNKEYQKLLEETQEVSLYKVRIENIPDTITVDQMTGIYPIIEE